ncbi:hypothetical protein VTL71DRAFT_9263 [Oculimacula yallundae]|uniref:Zn(2)-C6 fungal-type domain-containing protein n=1 Tax=Oculimacula yallundae TaxID=86028 RepID=A0ABR4BSI8_9HELO
MNPAAAKACISCRDRKRKCDRVTPSCSLCRRLGRRCRYEAKILDRADTTALSPTSRVHFPKDIPLSAPPSFDSNAFLKSSVDTAITEKLALATGALSDVRSVAAKYFESIHLWFPVLSEHNYYEHLPITFTQPCAEYSLLSLSMALIVSIPSEKETRETFSSLYMLVKSSIAIVEAANIHSLRVVQSRLLVSLFEVGHAIEPAAFMSLGTTARAAAAIGLNQALDGYAGTNEETITDSELELRIWWGIVMLDRWYTLERGHGLCATHDLGAPQQLPRDGSIWDQKAFSSNKPLPLSTPSSIRVGPFARQAQVSHVLDILMMHLRDQKLTKTFDADSADQIARTLTAFSALLPEETPQPWPRYCGAIGMCYSAMMILYNSRPKTDLSCEFNRSDAPESLKSTLARIRIVSTKFDEKIQQVDRESISPFPPHGLTKAATTRYRLWSETSDHSHLEAADSLLTMVRHFSKRWLNAAKLVTQLEEVRSANVPSNCISPTF